jgi:hypothetical protein
MPSDGYDVLRRLPGGESLWVATSDNLIQAQQRIGELKASKPDAEYAIFDVKNSRLIG